MTTAPDAHHAVATAGLIKRLRSVDASWSQTGEWCAEAADAIAALVAGSDFQMGYDQGEFDGFAQAIGYGNEPTAASAEGSWKGCAMYCAAEAERLSGVIADIGEMIADGRGKAAVAAIENMKPFMRPERAGAEHAK